MEKKLSFTRIRFNGQNYKSVDEMPPEVRQAYERMMGMMADKNGDGVPDLFEGTGGTSLSVTNSRIIFNGQEYGSVDEMPPDARRAFEDAMRRVDGNADGLPDALQRQDGAPAAFSQVDQISTGRPGSSAPVFLGSRDRRGGDSRFWIAIAVIIVLLAIIGGLLGMMFLNSGAG